MPCVWTGLSEELSSGFDSVRENGNSIKLYNVANSILSGLSVSFIICYNCILRKNSACRILRLSQADICNLKQVIFLIRLNLATLKG